MRVTELIDLAHARAVARYQRDRDEMLLWETLTPLGFDADEIQEHVDRPGWRMRQGVTSA